MTPRSSFRSDSSNLDVLRAVAVLSVFFAHLHDIIWGGHPLLGWHFGQMGVLIFFVHTSFVLMLSLERTPQTGRALFQSFYLRRFFRIYPFAMFCVTLAMLLHAAPGIGETTRYWTAREFASNLALTTNLTYTDNMVGGLWTLPLEVQMYVALPFLFLIGRVVKWPAMAALWVLSIPLALLQLNTTGRLNVLGYVPCFLAGVIAWKLSLTVKRRLPGWSWPLGFVAVWPFFFFATHEQDMYFRWAFCLALGLIIPHFQEIHFAPLQAAAHTVAKYSYGIYLSHTALIKLAGSFDLLLPIRLAILAGLIIVVPFAVFHLIEQPMIRLGNRIASRRLISRAAVSPAVAGFSRSEI